MEMLLQPHLIYILSEPEKVSKQTQIPRVFSNDKSFDVRDFFLFFIFPGKSEKFFTNKKELILVQKVLSLADHPLSLHTEYYTFLPISSSFFSHFLQNQYVWSQGPNRSTRS